MKKLMLAAVCFALIGAGSAVAQQDTTKARTKQTPTQTPTQRQSDQMRDDMTGWTTVPTTDVPASLRTTLGDRQYQGWESGTIYTNQAGDTYSVQIGDPANRKTYYFDKNGKTTKRPMDKKKDN
jgi:hypothetical protein